MIGICPKYCLFWVLIQEQQIYLSCFISSILRRELNIDRHLGAYFFRIQRFDPEFKITESVEIECLSSFDNQVVIVPVDRSDPLEVLSQNKGRHVFIRSVLVEDVPESTLLMVSVNLWYNPILIEIKPISIRYRGSHVILKNIAVFS